MIDTSTQFEKKIVYTAVCLQSERQQAQRHNETLNFHYFSRHTISPLGNFFEIEAAIAGAVASILHSKINFFFCNRGPIF